MGKRSPDIVLGIGVIFVLMCGITVFAYLSLVIPEDRNNAFYISLVSSCIAEFVLFGYLAYTILARDDEEPDFATRMRLSSLVFLWFLVILITSGVAAAPSLSDNFFSDQVLVIQLVITILFVAAVFFQHNQSVAVQRRNEAPQQERKQLEAYSTGITPLLKDLRDLARERPDDAVALEGVIRRVDMVRTELASSSAVRPRDGGRAVETGTPEQIEERLAALHEAVKSLIQSGDENFSAMVKNVRQAADQAHSIVSQREDTLSF